MPNLDVDKPARAGRPGRILALSSQVVSGAVGLRSAAFALERRGHAVLPVPTIVLPWHPGHGRGTAVRPDEAAFAGLLGDLANAPMAAGIDGILTGYFAAPAQVRAAAALVDAVRAANPAVVVLVDPVSGDAGGPYVAAEVIAALRDELLPRADIATPNRHELALLTGANTGTRKAAIRAAGSMAPPVTVVTSAPGADPAAGSEHGSTGALLVSDAETLVARHAEIPSAPHGTGDLFSALFLSEWLAGGGARPALARALSGTLALVHAAAAAGTDELPIAAGQDALVDPPTDAVAIEAASPATAGADAGETGFLAGVDGCRSGWIAVLVAPEGALRPRLVHVATFAELMARDPRPAVVAIDMPIGLPERVDGPGRAAEKAVRPLLGERQSSVFSVPSRSAVMAGDYASACSGALATSDPPRKVSRQSFMLFPKIREIDAYLAERPDAPVYEVHPEVGFWRLNGARPMPLPKKVKGKADPSGIAERIRLLCREGYDPAFFESPRPAGCGLDDLVDAAVNALVARRIARGEARPFPDPPERDARGLAIAIWA